MAMRWLAGSLGLVAEFFAAVALLGPWSGPLDAQSQGQGQTQPPGPGVGFRNELKIPLIVQGVSLINNMQRRGQPFVVQPGKTVWDNNLPAGMRYYTVYEANQQRILLRDRNVRIQKADQFFAIRLNPGGPTPIKMEEAAPMP
jgi:hypothetical protein